MLVYNLRFYCFYKSKQFFTYTEEIALSIARQTEVKTTRQIYTRTEELVEVCSGSETQVTGTSTGRCATDK